MRDQAIVGLLLAAGRSRRFGGDKLTHRLPDGQAMVAHCAATLSQATDHCVVLARAHHATLPTLLAPLRLTLQPVALADQGMGHTLAAGVAATPDAAGWIVALADMPLLQASTVAAVARALREGASIVAPSFQGQRGHPVGFSRIWFDALCALQGDTGARPLLRAHADQVTLIPVPDPGCLQDIDTPADLAEMAPRMRP
jgi:molybdenum cofactor cytidylyltransferase